MAEKLVGLARLGAKLLMIELFLPGGTLLVLALLLARQLPPGGPGKLFMRFPFPGRNWQPVLAAHRSEP